MQLRPWGKSKAFEGSCASSRLDSGKLYSCVTGGNCHLTLTSNDLKWYKIYGISYIFIYIKTQSSQHET